MTKETRYVDIEEQTERLVKKKGEDEAKKVTKYKGSIAVFRLDKDGDHYVKETGRISGEADDVSKRKIYAIHILTPEEKKADEEWLLSNGYTCV